MLLRHWKNLDYGQRALLISFFLAAVIWICPPWTLGSDHILGFAPGTWGLAAYRARFQFVSPWWAVLSFAIISVGIGIFDHAAFHKHQFLKGPLVAIITMTIVCMLIPVWNCETIAFNGIANYPFFFHPDITNLFIGPLFHRGYLLEDGEAPHMFISVEATLMELGLVWIPMLLILIYRRLIDIPRDNKRLLHCQTCGYNLRGLTSNSSCPECGKSLEKAQAALLRMTEST